MRVILDTHTFIWQISDSARLSETARQAITNTENQLLISIASLWEIAIKVNLGKLTLSRSFMELIPEQLIFAEIDQLPIRLEHLDLLISLPLHHRDPFDRLLIAQALTESLPIISRDPMFKQYGVPIIW
jgi:PIN domain nuclease of toxin-antitoxin system